jgi:hypothetical protein
VDTVGTRTVVNGVNPPLGPTNSGRIYQGLDDGSVGFQGVEYLGGIKRQDTIYATSLGAGKASEVTVYDSRTGAARYTFAPYAGFQGGVRVALGDVTGDGIEDIVTIAGPGAGPHVKVFDGKTKAEVRSFFAYSPGFRGGVNIAVGDIDGDNREDIITAISGIGAGPHVKAFSGQTGGEIRSFYAYAPTFQGGVSIASADINGDGKADIVTGAGPGAGPHVKVFDGVTNTEIRSYFAYASNFIGGVAVATGDLNGDKQAEIIVTPLGGAGPHVKVFDGATLNTIASFYYNDVFSPSTFVPTTRSAPVNAAVFDSGGVTGSKRQLLLSKGSGSRPKVSIYDIGANNAVGLVRDITIADTTFGGGIFVGASSNS